VLVIWISTAIDVEAAGSGEGRVADSGGGGEGRSGVRVGTRGRDRGDFAGDWPVPGCRGIGVRMGAEPVADLEGRSSMGWECARQGVSRCGESGSGTAWLREREVAAETKKSCSVGGGGRRKSGWRARLTKGRISRSAAFQSRLELALRVVASAFCTTCRIAFSQIVQSFHPPGA
jgi:hypothetical protein